MKHQTAFLVGRLGDCRNILHLHCLRPRAFAINNAGIGADERANAVTDQGIVIGCFNAKALEE